MHYRYYTLTSKDVQQHAPEWLVWPAKKSLDTCSSRLWIALI